MELHIQTEFDCVFYINGEFCERADSLEMSEFDVGYVTVLPLGNTLLPYTVKLGGAAAVNTELACGIRLCAEHYLLKLAPRYMTVYASTQPAASVTAPTSPISRLFTLVHSGDVAGAYGLLSDGLKSGIDKSTLAAFFEDCTQIAECSWDTKFKNRFFLIDKNGNARLCEYKLQDGFIDDLLSFD